MSEALLRLLSTADPAARATDADLLAWVRGGRGDGAVDVLVGRYAGLVWRVCRGTAGDRHAAEDAFQATFLALTTKAPAVRGSVPGWLSRVAYHAALKARAARRRTGPGNAPEPAAGVGVDPSVAAERAEAAAALWAELDALPDRHRVPVVLCHLDGLTQAEAARRLGVPVGTVATRVRRGLDRLRDRLARRGIVAPTAGIVALLAADAGAVPVAVLTAVRRSGASPPADLYTLAEGAVAAMSPTYWKAVAGFAVIAVGALAAGAFVAANPPAVPAAAKPADDPPKATKSGAVGPPTSAQLKQTRSQLERIAIAVHRYADDHGGTLPGDLYDAKGRPLLSWRVALLPQLEQDYLYGQFKLDEPWDSEHNKKLLAHMPKVYRTAGLTTQRPGDTLVQAFAGPNAGFEPGKTIKFPLDYPDGTSNTILAVETGPAVPWTKPADLSYTPDKPLPRMDGLYADRFLAVTFDGATHDIRWNLPEATYRGLIERADGNVFGPYAAPPLRPLTKEDKERVALLQKIVDGRRQYYARLETQRKDLINQLEKTGGVPDGSGLRDDSSVEDWEELLSRFDAREKVLRAEVDRLEEALKKRSPDKP